MIDVISGAIFIALVSFGFDILNHGMETKDDGWRYLPEMVSGTSNGKTVGKKAIQICRLHG